MAGIVETDQNITDEGKITRLKQLIKTAFSTIKNAGGIGFLANGFKFKNVGMNSVDMNYVEQKKLTKEDMMFLFRTPVLVIGEHEKANRAGSDTIIGNWYNTTVRGMKNLVETQWNKPTLGLASRISDDPNVFIHFALEQEPIYMDILTRQRLENFKEGFAMGGVTPNEVATVLGTELSKEEAADKKFLPLNLVPLEDKLAQPDPGKEGDDSDDEEENSTTVSSIKWDDAKKAAVWNEFDQNIKARKKSYKKIMEEILGDMFNEAAASLATRGKAFKALMSLLAQKQDDFEGILDEDLINRQAWARTIEIKSKPHLEASFVAGAQATAGIMGSDTDPDSISSQAFISTRLSLLSNSVVNSVENQVRASVTRDIEAAILEGTLDALTVESVANSIQALGRSVRDWQANRIARTELVVANNEGSQRFMEQGGAQKKMWLSQRDSKVRDEHLSLDGTIVGIKANFITSDGAVMYPQSINERCTAVPA